MGISERKDFSVTKITLSSIFLAFVVRLVYPMILENRQPEDPERYKTKRLQILQQKFPELVKQLPQSKKAYYRTQEGIDYDGPAVWDTITSSIYFGPRSHNIALANEETNNVSLYMAEKPFAAGPNIYCPGIISGLSVLACSYYRMASVFGVKIVIWDVENETFFCRLSGHSDYIQSIIYDPSNPNQLFSGSDDKTIKVWDIRTDECVRTLKDRATVYSVAVNPRNGKTCAWVNGNNELSLWDIGHGKIIKTVPGSMCVKYNNAGTLLATGGPGIARLYNASLEQINEISLPGQWGQQKAEPISFAFAPDGSIIMSGQLPDIVTFNATMSKIQSSFQSGLLDVTVHYTEDGSKILSSGLFTTDGGTAVRIWDLKKIAAAAKLQRITGSLTNSHS